MKEKIELFKDRNDNLYIKTGAKKGFMVRISDGTRHDGTTAGDFIPLSAPEDDPYSYWPCCDVQGCDQVSCSGGGCWKDTGYWSVCTDHSQMFRDGKPQPQMKQSAIDREKSRDEDGCLPIKEPEATEGKENEKTEYLKVVGEFAESWKPTEPEGAKEWIYKNKAVKSKSPDGRESLYLSHNTSFDDWWKYMDEYAEHYAESKLSNIKKVIKGKIKEMNNIYAKSALEELLKEL